MNAERPSPASAARDNTSRAPARTPIASKAIPRAKRALISIKLIWRRDANDWFTDKRRAASRLGAEGLVEQPSAETVAGYLGIDADGIFFGTFGVSPLAVQSVAVISSHNTVC